MTRTLTSPYDVAEHLRTPEEMAAYLDTAMEEAGGDAALIAKALGDVARAKGMSQVAHDAGLSRESLYKAFSGDRVPSLDTVLRVVEAPGLKLRAEAAPRRRRRGASPRVRELASTGNAAAWPDTGALTSHSLSPRSDGGP